MVQFSGQHVKLKEKVKVQSIHPLHKIKLMYIPCWIPNINPNQREYVLIEKKKLQYPFKVGHVMTCDQFCYKFCRNTISLTKLMRRLKDE